MGAVVDAVGLALTIAQTLFSALQTEQVIEMCSLFRCEPELEQLKGTMETVKAVLLDIDSKRQGLSHKGQVWVEKLKDAVYEVDDLVDEFTTIRQQRNQMRDAKLFEKVRQFFSRNNEFIVAFNVSQEIKMLREKLDATAKDHADFGFTSDVTQPVERREQTCSVISELKVIGREAEKEAIVGMLLSDSRSSDQNVSFVSIVGMGGLGKTTLAQLAYNDEEVKGAFAKRVWVCVSEDFGVTEILGKILEKQESDLQVLQRKVRSLLAGKKYLLVLDDVWNESHKEWRKLKPHLVSDKRGSKIMVTSRSKDVATSIGQDSTTYELKGLSEENSWGLFKRIAFKQSEDQQDEHGLVDIGKNIAKKCGNVPLSIMVIASLLHGKEKSLWELFSRSNDLAKMSPADGRPENSIMPTLMFSYYQLTSELKSCFSFCSLFPKDRIIEKEELISLWLAEGFLIKPNNVLQSMEDVGEQYFKILLNRCFFQDVQLDEYGDVYSFKMHDLMHDLAVEVAGKESLIITPATQNHPGQKIRHQSEDWGRSASFWSDSPHEDFDRSNLFLSDSLRTFMLFTLNYRWRSLVVARATEIISKCRHLRVLALRRFGSNITLPDGKLLHLRYLDLSENYVEMLSESITNLHNLQILKLCGCVRLKALPKEMSKLVNLRTLDIQNCKGLTHMPWGMSNLTKLHRLTNFVVGGVDPEQAQGSKLIDLKALRNLKGDLCIRVGRFWSHNNMPQATDRAFILKDARLRNLEIRCPEGENNPVGEIMQCYQSEAHEKFLEDLNPNDDIRRMGLFWYKGTKMPSWASMMGQHVTSLSQFRNLKVVELANSSTMEYIESDAGWARANESGTFFPVLEKLELRGMFKLKGWWREVRWREMEGGAGCLVDAKNSSIDGWESKIYFPRLRHLVIESCWSMTYFPPCPHVKQLELKKVSRALTFCMKGGVVSSSSTPVSLCLEKLEIDNGRLMNSILRDDFVGGAIDIQLASDGELESMGTLRKGLERAYGVLGHLSIRACPKLDMEDEEEEGVPWKYLQSLSSLVLASLPKMVKLPKGLRYLTSLQSLTIEWGDKLEELGECIGFLTSLRHLRIEACTKLKSIPESMRHLTSLTTLVIRYASIELMERCQQPDGEDWPNICHIPNRNLIKPRFKA